MVMVVVGARPRDEMWGHMVCVIGPLRLYRRKK